MLCDLLCFLSHKIIIFSLFAVKVKWGKETYPDVELDTSESPEVFRAQVFALTGVQISRQKLLLKGSTLKPDTWDGAKLKDVCEPNYLSLDLGLSQVSVC